LETPQAAGYRCRMARVKAHPGDRCLEALPVSLQADQCPVHPAIVDRLADGFSHDLRFLAAWREI